MFMLENKDTARMNYIIALYDNAVTPEIRSTLRQYIDTCDYGMKICDDIMRVFKDKVYVRDVDNPYATDLIQYEYEELGLDEFVSFIFIKDIISLNLYMISGLGYSGPDVNVMLHNIVDNADTITDNDVLKTDLYLIVIRLLSAFNYVYEEFELARKVMNYYNSLPEESRMISILPDSLAAV